MSYKETTGHISSQLRQIRNKRGMTQSQVADKADTDVNYYAKVERGEATPSLKTFGKIVKALGAKSSDILPF
jgi:transcriptional regulator with XRE-family HTH domain